jgi:hypothetical protein
MTMSEKTRKGFVDGTERIKRLTSDPARTKRIGKIREDGCEMDRVYAMNLAMIRKAAELTQDEVAQRLGIGQGDVSKLERRDDRCSRHCFATSPPPARRTLAS